MLMTLLTFATPCGSTSLHHRRDWLQGCARGHGLLGSHSDHCDETQSDSQIEVLNDDGTEKRTSKTAWTGTTVFQITGEARKELCMFSCHYAKKMGREVKTQMIRQQRKKYKKSVSERDLTVFMNVHFSRRQSARSSRVSSSTTFGLLTQRRMPRLSRH